MQALDQKEQKQLPLKGKKVNTPTVLQMEAVECGAAALAIVLGYYRRYVPLEELRIECGVSRDGSKASNMLKAARKFGMLAKGFQRETEELYEMKLPLIIFWKFNHFLVLEGYDRQFFYVSDPAFGKRKISHEEFDTSFTGVVLAIEPGPDFRQGGVKSSVLTGLKQRLKRVKLPLLYIICIGLFLTVPGIVVPVFSKIFIDEILIKGLQDWFRTLLFGMILVTILQTVLFSIQQRILLRMETSIAISESSRFLLHALRLPLNFFVQRFSGDIANRVQINDQVAALIANKLTGAFINVVLVVFYGLVMFYYDVPLTCIVLLGAAVNIYALYRSSRKITDTNVQLLSEQGQLIGYSMAGIANVETIKATGTESEFFSSWAGYLTKAKKSQQQLGFVTQRLSSIPSLMSGIMTAAILGFGGLRIMSGGLTIGMLIAFQALAAALMSPINQLLNLATEFQTLKGNMARLDDVLAYPEDPMLHDKSSVVVKSSESGSKPGSSERAEAGYAKLKGAIEFTDINFGYNSLEPPLIENFSLLIKPGRRIALVGRTGSGKSTISRLLMGLYKPWSGEFLFDGVPREAIPRDLLINSLAMVDQDIFLFEGSIRENLTMWNPSIGDADILRASKDALIHDVIASRARGYESHVEEGGANFSGGERQRLEIARALAINPSILIMDEATSALDSNTEKIIDDNIRRRGCTSLIIAHRLSTIRDCDEIIILENGKIAQRGTHEEMKTIKGPYSQLISAE